MLGLVFDIWVGGREKTETHVSVAKKQDKKREIKIDRERQAYKQAEDSLIMCMYVTYPHSQERHRVHVVAPPLVV